MASVTLFFIIATLIWLALYLYTLKRFILRLHFKQTTRHRLAWFTTLIFLGAMSYMILSRLDLIGPQALMLLSILIGTAFILFVSAVIYDLIHLLMRRFIPRQERLMTFVDGALLTGIVLYLLYAYLNAVRAPQIVVVPVTIPNAPSLRLVQLSDLHLGRERDANFFAKILATSKSLAPDAILITGDLYDGPPNNISATLAPLATLRTPVYVVSGNHEYFHDYNAFQQALKRYNATLLTNTHQLLGPATKPLALAGIPDLVASRFGYEAPDINRTLSAIDPNIPVILMAHQPKAIHLLPPKRVALTLSGHTHGGQIFPFGLFVLLDQPCLKGLCHLSQTTLYVNQGTAFWGPHLRMASHNEITLLLINPKERASMPHTP
ncbi:MAG: metallophosphoesterase [Campylobacterales bacterium]